jgi:predicted DNA-binding protein (MmcQ/YjbR family)
MNTEKLRSICLAMPAAQEDIKWGADLVFTVGGKMFCVTSLEGPFKASFKVPDESFDSLCSREGIVPAPYMARARWVQVSNEAGFTKGEWEQMIAESHRLVVLKLTKKQQQELKI